MCLIAFALNAHPRYRLIVAANRDEFHHRPTEAAHWWPDAPGLFGGRDLQQGGTWMACTRAGRWAAVTNVRRMVPPNPAAPSRGALVADYLRGTHAPAAAAERLLPEAPRYAGFNLLLGDGSRCAYLGSEAQPPTRELADGLHAVSNASLDTPWPKLLRLRQALAGWCASANTRHDALFEALADETPVADNELPDTGVGLAHERFLATPFIRSPTYGTRASTLLTIGDDGIVFHERRFGANGVALGETRERLA